MNLDIFTPSYLIRIHEIIFENWIMEQHKKVFVVVFFCLFVFSRHILHVGLKGLMEFIIQLAVVKGENVLL